MLADFSPAESSLPRIHASRWLIRGKEKRTRLEHENHGDPEPKAENRTPIAFATREQKPGIKKQPATKRGLKDQQPVGTADGQTTPGAVDKQTSRSGGNYSGLLTLTVTFLSTESPVSGLPITFRTDLPSAMAASARTITLTS
ncbi:hypothetical protein Pla8534_04880 [Lignipirellula cremea]|uniref:Uncharacterized protein n=1 Tax=Lignipirellula cremea TaxID=2528010 RepID=A0A518DLM3_9BACT|nr:hypothetical protein Pla8534_04880 [Lignipirellula cremea]